MRRKSPSVWFLSPALATALFLAAQIAVSFMHETPEASISGAGAEAKAPSTVPMTVRVVEQIRPIEEEKRPTQVPDSEQELLELLDDDGSVVFFNDEVEVVETTAREFDEGETGVIRARARFIERR